MATKKNNRLSIPIDELLECIVTYSEYLHTPPPYAEVVPDSEVTRYKRSFYLDTAEEKLDAIQKILWGDEVVKKKRGNKSFLENDIKQLWLVKKEKGEEFKTKDAFLEECVDYVQLRSTREEPDIEHVKRRLTKAYKILEQTEWKDPDSQCHECELFDEEDDGFQWSDDIRDEVWRLAPWLIKYKDQILELYKQQDSLSDKT